VGVLKADLNECLDLFTLRNLLMKNVSKFLAIATLMVSAGLAQAGNATGTLPVSANVTANCTLTTTAVAFGSYDPLATSLATATGGVNVACTKGATGVTVGLGNGGNFTTIRNMAGSGTNTDKLPYSLMLPPSNVAGVACATSGGTLWTTTAVLTLPTSPGKAARTFNVCGQIAAGQDVSVDTTYTDTVQVTVTF
jgi:spore coat protein U-like protein